MKHLSVNGLMVSWLSAWLVVVGLYFYSTLPPPSNAQPSGSSIDPLTDLPDLSPGSRQSLRQAILSAQCLNESPRRFLFALWHVFREKLRGDDLPVVADSLLAMMAQLDCIFFNASGSGFNPASADDREVLANALVQLATEWNAQFGSGGPLTGFFRNRLYYAHEQVIYSIVVRVRHEFSDHLNTDGQALWDKLMVKIYEHYRQMSQGQRDRFLMNVDDDGFGSRPGRMPRRVFAQSVALFSVGRLMPDPEKGELKRRYETWLPPPDPQWDTWSGLRRAQLLAKLDHILYDTY